MKLQRPDMPTGVDADLSIAIAAAHLETVSKEMNIPLRSAYVYKGVHERTAKGDDLVVSLQTSTKKTMVRYLLKRDSLYHILPEYLFHPLDRYADYEEKDKKEEKEDKEAKFKKRRKDQKEMEENALRYFYPCDKVLQEERIAFQSFLNDRILCNNTFIVDFITEGHRVNRNNRYINNAYPCIQWLRAYRGVKRVIEVALRLAFCNGIARYEVRMNEVKIPIDTKTCHCCLDGTIDDLFCGDTYTEAEELISVSYQTPIMSQKQIEILHWDIDEFKEFFQLWFLGLHQRLTIDFGDYTRVAVMFTGTTDNDLYLNYNTQLI